MFLSLESYGKAAEQRLELDCRIDATSMCFNIVQIVKISEETIELYI